ncbi:MAG: hypothetical protein Unbinned4409contig1002_19 [Prokaryotic dsDNA virus sp.]|nr:MAG: hypothetical protein Unbinned4409contig1002_19 [Prokaryotic dsDNA virus sp.]|tara:strand:+ start:11432 stop:11710 length:279 start_codon:yes stop_codon:yes gene_type:complete
MHKRYKEMLDEVSNYIHHLEETVLNYEEKLKDMELEDMIEDTSDSFEDELIKQKKHEEWAYSKTEGSDANARREALRKATARAELELKKLDS